MTGFDVKRGVFVLVPVAVALLALSAAPLGPQRGEVDRNTADRHVRVAELTPEQQAECQREQQALYDRLARCSDDECRRAVQAEIDAHNARCS